MSKQSGLGDKILWNGYDISGDVNSITSMGMPRGVFDDTGVDKFAMERLLLKRDGAMGFSATWNPGPEADAIHLALKGLSRSDGIMAYCRGQSLGAPTACMVALEVDYPFDRNNDGALIMTPNFTSNGYGIEWGIQGTAGVRTDTAATNGTSIDNGAATNFGLQCYAQCKSITGTSVTIKLQDSADNASWADLTAGAFTAFTTKGAARLQTARNATIRRYLRVVTTGTFTNAQFQVSIMRNSATVNF